jgi:F-type H+-transporting ATPase subunit b|uniref:ATP synthase subunit b, chloroplastic n=1 Tax=Pseudochloris wilhelmii TaxID=1418016 RepID=A0A097KQM2_9CHLO|nr:CF0 subunit I of ATP synthase [Pseudochloris wilhelmii]AIT95476.1 CF0 subunit I of ATP synthase [Pseudochloris wilhelmii]
MFFTTSVLFAEHFGFNTNILETNVLNLAVVLAIVITVIGDYFRTLLATRKDTILKNFREAEERAAETQQRLQQARLELEQAKKKAQNIREDILIDITNEKSKSIAATEQAIKSLGRDQQERLDIKQRQVQIEVVEKVIQSVVQQVREKLRQGLNEEKQIAFMNYQIGRFAKYQPQ